MTRAQSNNAAAEAAQGQAAPSQQATQQAPRQADRTGTIEATPLPREAIGMLSPSKFHAVNDKELAKIQSLEKPMSLVFAAFFGGVFMGTALPAASAIQAQISGQAQLGQSDLTYILICALSLGIGLAASFASAKTRGKVAGVVAEIRKRSKLYMPPGHPAAPSGS